MTDRHEHINNHVQPSVSDDLVDQFARAPPNRLVAFDRRLPAEVREPLDRQPHLGHVAGPTAVAAGVRVLGVDAEFVADDVGDVR